MSGRADELATVREDAWAGWLAAQIDEVENGLKTEVHALTEEVRKLRSVLTAILISIIVALVSVPIGIIWQVAAG
jgi:hypothetical protein